MSKQVKIQITHWITGSVLFEYESVGNTLAETLREAFKAGADLRGADLRGADLYGADLYGADLYGADLYGADLYGADLYGADLRGANLRGADLRGAKNITGDATDFWWHVHHEILVEQLTEPVRARINYIKKDKPKDEIELRLQLLKPVLGKIPTTDKGWTALHKKECGCGWDGKTIFTKKNGLVKDVK